MSDGGCVGWLMRIITIRQPWAWAIIHGGKDVENRSRNIAGDYRGLVAIHAGLREDVNAFSLSDSSLPLNAAVDEWERSRGLGKRTARPWDTFGAIIGVVDLDEVLPPSYYDEADARDWYCSEWAQAGQYQLVLSRPRPLRNPIPYKGALGLRELDRGTVGAIRAQLVGVDG